MLPFRRRNLLLTKTLKAGGIPSVSSHSFTAPKRPKLLWEKMRSCLRQVITDLQLWLLACPPAVWHEARVTHLSLKKKHPLAPSSLLAGANNNNIWYAGIGYRRVNTAADAESGPIDRWLLCTQPEPSSQTHDYKPTEPLIVRFVWSPQTGFTRTCVITQEGSGWHADYSSTA